MVSIDDSGKGSLYVDGQVSELELNVGTNVDDVATFNNGTAIGTTFSTISYPNKCVSSARRSLKFISGPWSANFQELDDGYANTTGLNLNPATGDCCTMKIAQKCSDTNTTRDFEGLVDEVAIWNRGLSENEVQNAMFNMPASRFERKLTAPRGLQIDVAAGRVLWARFNNPCTDRSSGIADEASATSGFVNAQNQVETSDLEQDLVSWKAFKTHSKYAYTGVPWLPPYIRDVQASGDLSIDGGSAVSISGIGFAKSPFFKCVNSFAASGATYPTPLGNTYDLGNDHIEYDAHTVKVRSDAEGGPTHLPKVSKSIGSPVFAFDSAKPSLFKESLSYPTNAALRSDKWDVDKNGAALRSGMIPVFEEVPERSHYSANPNTFGETIHGGWEVIQCEAPTASFPSDRYGLSVSNDAGLSIVNTKTRTYTEYALVLDGSVALSADSKIVGSTYSMWFQISEVTLTFATLFSLSNGLGFTYEDEIVYATYGTQKLGSLGTKTSLNEWHHIAISIDSGQTRSYIDAQTVVAVAMPNIEGGYALQSVGNNFKGVIDEFKVFRRALSTEEVLQSTFRRELDMGAMNAYYRFNQDFLDYTGNTTISVIGKANANFISVGAPWEPTSIYTANGTSVETMPVVSHTGRYPMEITGFNFANHQWLNCNFGAKALEFTLTGRESEVNLTALASITTGVLGRPDGKAQSIDGAEVYSVSGNSTKATYESISSISCNPINTTAIDEDAAFLPVTHMSVGETTINLPEVGPEFEGPPQIALSKSALACNGIDEHASIGGLGEKLASAGAYTISFFTKPTPWTASKTEGNETLTILAIESATTQTTFHRIDYLLDGRFVYYDDYIKYVSPARAGKPADPLLPAFHHIMLSVDANGKGKFVVDGEESDFTTSASVPASAEATLCASKSTSVATNFYPGIVDDFTVFPGVLKFSDVLVEHFDAHGSDESESALLSIDWEIGPEQIIGGLSRRALTGKVMLRWRTPALSALPDLDQLTDLGELDYPSEVTLSHPSRPGMVVFSVGPRVPPQALEVVPSLGSIVGGTSVTIEGRNFAFTENFKVVFASDSDTVLPGVVKSVTQTKIVVESPPGACLGQAQLRIVDGKLGFTYHLDGATFDYKPSMLDLQNGLVSHYPMDGPKHVKTASAIEVFDIIGSRSGQAPLSNAAANRDGVLNSALKTASLQIPAPATYLGEDFTICMWAKISDYANTKDLSQAHDLFEGWKMFCSVRNDEFYVNYGPASAAQAPVLASIFDPLVTKGTIDAFEMTVDDVWIYGRALSPCEIAARYYTAQSSIYAGASDDIKVTVGSTSQKFEGLESWVYLDDVMGSHTIASSSAGTWSVGVEDGKVFLSVSEACACTDSSCHGKHVSGKVKVAAKQWVHVGVSYDEGKSQFFIDGVLMDTNTFGITTHPLLEVALIGKSPPSPVDSSIEALEGQIYGIRFLSAANFTARSVKSVVICPPKDPELGGAAIAGFDLNEGDGSALEGFTALDGTKVELNATAASIQWMNATYDDATFVDETQVSIAGLTTWESGSTVFFGISTYTACGKMRLAGGEKFTVTFQRYGTSTLLDASVLDTNDGNYHVSISGLTCCGYRVTIVSISGFYYQTDIDVVAKSTSAAHTSVLAVQSEQCFGAPFKMEIESFDENGCPSISGTDTYSVKLQGPHDASAVVSYAGSGKYVAEFIPLAPGKYFAEFNLTTGANASTPLRTPFQCIDVCQGGSLVVNGDNGIEISEADMEVGSDLATELDFANATSGTLKAWIQPTGITEGDAFVVVKGSAADAKSGNFIKGYTLKLSTDYKVLEGSVYAGMGKIANITANTTISLNAWAHVAFTFEGEDMKLFVDGDIVAEKSVDWGTITTYANPNTIPMTVVQGFVGSIDDVMILSVAQDPLLLKEQVYCPPIAGNYDDVILYLPFNGYSDDAGTMIPGYGRTCRPEGAAKTCLTGYAYGEAILDPLSSPIDPLVPVSGVGTPGKTYSTVDAPPYQFESSYLSIKTEFSVVARDVCGFVY